MDLNVDALVAKMAQGIALTEAEQRDYNSNKAAVDAKLSQYLAGSEPKTTGGWADFGVELSKPQQATKPQVDRQSKEYKKQRDKAVKDFKKEYAKLEKQVKKGKMTSQEAAAAFLQIVQNKVAEVSVKSGAKSGVKGGAKSGDGSGNTYVFNNNITINITVSADIQAIIDAMTAALQEQTGSIIDALNSNNEMLINVIRGLVAQVIDKMDENEQALEEFFVGLVQTFADSMNLKLDELISLMNVIKGILEGMDMHLTNFEETVVALLREQLDLLQAIGIDLGDIKDTIHNHYQNEEDHWQREEEMLALIYDAITALRQELGNLTQEVRDGFNALIALVNAGNITLEELKALLQGIKQDVEDGNQINLEILAELRNTRQAIDQLKQDIISSNAANKDAIIAAINNLHINPSTGQPDLTALMTLLNEIKALMQGNNSLLTEINGKMDLINLALGTITTQLGNLLDDDGILAQILNAIRALGQPNSGYDDTQLMQILQAILAAINDCCGCGGTGGTGNNEGSGGDGEIGGELYATNPFKNGQGGYTSVSLDDSNALKQYLSEVLHITFPTESDDNNGGQVGIDEVIQNEVQQEFDLQSFNQAEFIIYDIMGRTVKTFKGSQVNNPAAMNTDLKYQTTTQVVKRDEDFLSAGTLKSSGLFDGLPNGKYFVEHIVK